MNAADLRKLYAYNDWANDRMIEVIAALSEEQFTRRIVSSYESIRDTLSHIAFAEWIWLQRWMGESPSNEWMKEPSFAAVRDRLHAVRADRNVYLAGLRDDTIASTIQYRSTRGDQFTMLLGELLIHCANHSTYHRGQLVTMLRQVGATPPNTDYTPFVREQLRG
jgi:uncharacterized damage-inducible protein DinB